MIDSITLFADALETAHIPRLLRNGKIISNTENDIRIFQGYLGNLRVRLNGSKIVIDGSLAEFQFGSNIHTLNFETLKTILLEIGKILGVPIKLFKIIRFEIGANLIMKNSVHLYNKLFGEMSRYDKTNYPNFQGVLYSNTLSSLQFYDKIRQLKRKKKLDLSGLEYENLLRFEKKIQKKSP